MPAGRPSKWSEELEHKAWDYANGDWQEAGHAFPSLVGLASYLNLNRTMLYSWKDSGKGQISDILDKINTEQQQVAWKNGLTGEYNPMLVKLLLGKHGYHDKQDNTHSGPDGGAIKTDTSFTFVPVGNDDKD